MANTRSTPPQTARITLLAHTAHPRQVPAQFVKLGKHKPSPAKVAAMNALLPRAFTKMMLTATSASHALIALLARATAAAAQAQVIVLIVFQGDTLTQHPPHGHVRTVTSDNTKAAQIKRHVSYAEVGNTRMSQNRPTAHPAKLAHSLLS
jgi:hypothetical protein